MNILKSVYNFICPTSTDNSLTLLGLNEKVNLIMTTLADIKKALADLASNIADEKNEVTAAVSALTQQVFELKAALADGVAVNTTDLDSILSSINGIDESVKAIYITPVTATETEVVEAAVETVTAVDPAPVVEEPVAVVDAVEEVITPVEEIPEVTVGPV